MYRAKRLAALLLIVIGCTWLVYSLMLQYSHITNPVFIWVFGVVVIGIFVRKGIRNSGM
jgi:hypothetical protein